MGLLKGKLGQSNLPSTHLLFFVVVFFFFFVVVVVNLSKCQWSFAKLYVCIDIVEILFGIANGQVLSILTRSSVRDMIVAGYYRFAFLLATFS